MGENQQPPKSHIATRLNVLFFFVFIFFAAVILRLAYVQIVEGEQYQHDLEKYSIRQLPIPAPRGRIIDVNHNVLVSNKPVFTVTYTSEQKKEINEEAVAEKLTSLLQMDEKIGTDKELIKKATELQTTLPITFKPEQSQKLIQQLTPKINALPNSAQLKGIKDYDLVKTAFALGLSVRSPFDENDREALQKKLPATIQVDGKNVDTKTAYDSQLLKYVISASVPYPIALEDKVKESLQKDVKSLLSKMPSAEELSSKTDAELLQYAARFDLDVALPLTPEQRQYQWHRISILNSMRDYSMPKFIPRRIKENASEIEVAKINENLSELPGINVIVEPVRQIRQDEDGAFATHILGYISPISASQVNEYLAMGYSKTDRIGVEGLERYYEKDLRGKDGIMDVQVNKDAETVVKGRTREAIPGNDLVLSLDYRFQSKLEEILKRNVNEMRRSAKGTVNAASAVVMNPNTGEVLAMANYPDYDLNLHYNRKLFNENYEKVVAPAQLNNVTRGVYPPASTVKPISVMMALQEKLTTPNESIFDPGYFQFGDVKKRNWKLGGHGQVDARRAIAVSNNTYMYTMGWRLKEREIGKGNSYRESFKIIKFYNQQFGLGVKTGIDLPSEKEGWPAPTFEMGRIADALIGQYDSFTPIQLAQYVSTIANGGYRIRPHMVKEIRKGSIDPKKPGDVITTIEPQVLNKININPSYLKVVQEGMRRVTQPGGTAATAMAGLPFSVAAKTGTAQTGGTSSDNSLILGYAPYENPKISFVVVVPHSGGHGSDRIARELLEAYHALYPLNSTVTPTE
ncbi:penicillin-binding protein [Brevibacillus laterosporus]|uniref:penicillin-binding transpeptidase domain-containing protein n=1 Tax=Brevibacillus laterosporus TaxID=1465 RepID=UPI000BD1D465|nr:penicillin-binding transpeptidase domain-containing protein [Brevibacillus laterosporus]PCN43217.1 penicillin-binding protein [Brevibacillus laterosporus]